MNTTINTIRAEDLTRVLYDDRTLRPPRTPFLNLFFNEVHTSDKDQIFMHKIAGSAKLAPLVMPTHQGRPVYEKAEAVEVVNPAYLKPKDIVDPERALKRQAGFGEFGPDRLMDSMTPEQRLNAIRADILKTHKETIYRRWEWMAVKALADGGVMLEGEDYPTTYVDFGRDPALSPTLAAADMWNNTTVDIVDQFEAWIDAMRQAKYGGVPSMVVMGGAAWSAFRKNDKLKEMLTRDVIVSPRPDIENGVRPPASPDEMRYVGMLTNGLPVYVHTAQYQQDDGTWTYYLDQRDVLLVGDVMGVACYGAIRHMQQLRAMEMWSYSWMEPDPSAEFIMTMSAPLMYPTAPNRSMRVRVLP